MDIEDLQKMKQKASAELKIAEQKQREINHLCNEIEEEVNARRGLVFALERMINLKN